MSSGKSPVSAKSGKLEAAMQKEREAIDRMKARQRKEIEAMMENERRLAGIREKARLK